MTEWIGLAVGAVGVGVVIFFQFHHAKRVEKEIIRAIWGKTDDEEQFLPREPR